MSSKWSTLVGGASSRNAGFIQSLLPEKSGNPMTLIVVVGVVVLVAWLLMRSNSASSSSAPSAPAEAAAAAAPVESPVQTVEVVPDAAAPGPADTVQPKFASVTDRLWSTSETPDVHMPFDSVEDGYTYTDFQRALLTAHRAPETVPTFAKASVAEDLAMISEQMAPLRDMITKSGKSLDQFMDDNMISLPENITDLWASMSGPTKSTIAKAKAFVRPEYTAEEASMLAREAMQTVPMEGVDSAAIVMREVLHSRTEAARLALELPEMPQEQLAAINYWRLSNQQPAAEVAKILISRV